MVKMRERPWTPVRQSHTLNKLNRTCVLLLGSHGELPLSASSAHRQHERLIVFPFNHHDAQARSGLDSPFVMVNLPSVTFHSTPYRWTLKPAQASIYSDESFRRSPSTLSLYRFTVTNGESTCRLASRMQASSPCQRVVLPLEVACATTCTGAYIVLPNHDHRSLLPSCVDIPGAVRC